MGVQAAKATSRRGHPLGWFRSLPLSIPILVIALLCPGPSPAESAPPDWQQTGIRSLTGLDALGKTQGIASDGNRIFFSWNLGLQSTELDPGTVISENIYQAIPPELRSLGLNHIGDIDFYDGILYAAVEDGDTEQWPHIVEYDPDTLETTGIHHLLDRTVLPTGVPWVAIDGRKGLAYTANWSGTDAINVHRLPDFEVVRQIPLSRRLERIQGADVYRGYLYASRDNGTAKSIEAIDLATGEVTTVVDRNLDPDREAQGIVIFTNRQGTTLITTDISRSALLDVNVRSYRIDGDTVPPSLVAFSPAGAESVRSGRAHPVRVLVSEPVTVGFEWSLCKGPAGKICSRTAPRGRGELPAVKPGTGVVRVPTRVDSGRKLPSGTYRLGLTPRDVADAPGPTVNRTVRIIRRR